MYIVFGYYDRHNLGDEIYKLVIPKLLHDIKVNELEFICLDDAKLSENIQKLSTADGVFIGGGDIFNSYFIPSIKLIRDNYKGIIVGLSIGFPYEDSITSDNLSYFDLIYTRNKSDIAMLRRKTSSETIRYIPDPVFLFKPTSLNINNTRDVIGFSIPGNLFQFRNFTNKCIRLINRIGSKKEIIFIPFDTSSTKESDVIPYENLHKQCPFIKIFNSTNVTEVIDKIRSLDVFVTARYHGILLASIAETPLVILKTTRKIQLLIDQLSYPENQIIDLHDEESEYSMPINRTSKAIESVLSSKYSATTNPGLLNQMKFVAKSRKYLSTFYNKQFGNVIIRQIEYLSNNHHQPIINKSIQAALISHQATGLPDSKYLYGISENLDKGLSIDSMLSWLHLDRKQKPPPMIENIPMIAGPPRNSYYLPIKEYEIFQGLHRHGWSWIYNHMLNFSKSNGIYLDSFIDRTFHWNHDYNAFSGKIPYHHEWIGFVHHPMSVIHSENSTDNLFKKKTFLDSLLSCKGLYVLALDLKRAIQQKLAELKLLIPVYFLEHPTGSTVHNFDIHEWEKHKPIISIGGWQRRPLDIYRANYPHKFVLRGIRMGSIFPPQDLKLIVEPFFGKQANFHNYSCIEISGPCTPGNNAWLNDLQLLFPTISIRGHTVICDSHETYHRITMMIDSVKILEHVSDDEYDQLLTKNVVFLSLYDCAAVNTINECIIRGTPLLINRLPETERLLGSGYPLFWTDLDKINELVNYDNLIKASGIMKDLSKKLNITNFLYGFHTSEPLIDRTD